MGRTASNTAGLSYRVPQAEQGGYKVLYNSELRFRSRLYADLETVLYHVRLFQPLAQLVKHTVLYVRNTVPQPVFQALNRYSRDAPGPLLPQPLVLCQGSCKSILAKEDSLPEPGTQSSLSWGTF